MKKRQAGPERAALYYRHSTDEQEGSLPRQKSQVEPYVRDRGYVIVAVKEDPGVPGSEFKKRPGFQRLRQVPGRVGST